jgi:CBS domain-containing protein
MTALALGGLAVAGYVMRRRARRRTPYERFVSTASDYLGLASDYLGTASGYASDVASEMSKQRNPAWLGALAAAAALPLAYYAWPSSQPSYGDRAREQARAQADGLSSALGGYWHDFADRMPGMADSARDWSTQMRRRMPSADDIEMPSGWSMPGDWSAKPDVMLPIGLIAVSALALYLARRATAKPRLNARIGDIMTRKPRVIQPDATVADAAAMMRRLDVGALPVCDGSRLIGMVTDRDITTRATADGRDPHLTPVRDVMSPGVAWATEDDPVEEAARIMREHQIRRLPIVDERHSLVGVVSLGDLATEVGDDVTSGDTLERISE